MGELSPEEIYVSARADLFVGGNMKLPFGLCVRSVIILVIVIGSCC